jgi:hypothetical protein
MLSLVRPAYQGFAISRTGLVTASRDPVEVWAAMFANMTTIKGELVDLEEGARMAADALLPWVRQFDGYRGMIVLSDGENGTARFVTFWEDKDALDRSEYGRKQVREQMAKTAGVEIDDVRPYAVLLVDGFE